jgi:Iap family predicted aminopeptidase
LSYQFRTRKWRTIAVILFILLTIGCSSIETSELIDTTTPTQTATAVPSQEPTTTPTVTPTATNEPASDIVFDGDSAYEQLVSQVEFGPRYPGSPAHTVTGDYIIEQLEISDWLVEEQITPYESVIARNIIGKKNIGAGPVILIGAHYDTRRLADRSLEPQEPVPGAVDGASGVAVLLELARTLELEQLDREIWLTFFDLEDQGSGGMPGFIWAAGSRIMADTLETIPESVIVVDMVGDASQQLFFEGNSDPELQTIQWQIAKDLGFGERFIPQLRHTMIDDHLPFAERGIPTSLIIDFDYPYWHTTGDTVDKASPESLFSVGRTLEYWLEEYLTTR